MNPTKWCRICGDKALGFNFNGLSCESCRLFFIRNAHRHEHLQCKFMNVGKCEITLESRNCCQRCRMDKCVEIGMKKELIKGKYSIQNKNSQVILLNESSVFFDRNLQINECSLLYELQGAMLSFREETSLEIVGPSTTLRDAYQFSLQHIRMIIKFCKNIRAFTDLQECDQLVLLKEFFCHIQSIRFAFMFNRQQDGYPMLLNSTTENNECNAIFIKITIFAQWKRKNVEQFFRRVLHSLQLEMENDSVVRNLFIAHALFKPLEGVTCPELIRYHYHVYRHLLKRYYEQKYGGCERAARKFSSLMQLLSSMSQVKQLCKEMFADLNVCGQNDQTSEVLDEIFRGK